MPELGEVKRIRGHYCIWAACETCGKERWTLRLAGKPKFRLCKSCANRANRPCLVGRTRESNNAWKGGIRERQGYIFIYKPEYPRARRDGYIKRAILVLEEKLGRCLLPGMDSHHKNGIKDDDRPENLDEELHSKHSRLHQLLRHRMLLPSGRVPLERRLDSPLGRFRSRNYVK